MSDDKMDSLANTDASYGLFNADIKRGVTIIADMEMDPCLFGEMANVLDTLIFRIQGSIPLAPETTVSLGGGIAMKFPEGSSIAGAAVMMKVEWSGGGIDLDNPVTKPEPQALMFELTGALGIMVAGELLNVQISISIEFQGADPLDQDPKPQTNLRLEGDLVGCWKNPFGAKGLQVCDVGVGWAHAHPHTYMHTQTHARVLAHAPTVMHASTCAAHALAHTLANVHTSACACMSISTSTSAHMPTGSVSI